MFGRPGLFSENVIFLCVFMELSLLCRKLGRKWGYMFVSVVFAAVLVPLCGQM